jgi:crotonobetainyl-CoA:carnitine CoA-transferase CaiB-like acyl-CoA transferase
MPAAVLSGVRVVEVAMFGPDAVGMHLADLGADVIKVEQPGLGDPARLLGKAFRGESPATRRWNRGKRSIVVDLRSPAGLDVFRDLVAGSEAVIEGMRPGALSRRGVGYKELLLVNPSVVFASVSGWGQSGPYRDLAAHGLAFDAFAGLAPARDVDGRTTRPLGHVWTGLEAGPLYAAFAVVSGIVRARQTGEPCEIEVSEADAAVVWNGWRIAYEAAVARHGFAPEDPEARQLVDALEVAAEGGGRTGDRDLCATDVRYQYYRAQDGEVLLMATEQTFWRNFCAAVGRPDLLERWPGEGYLDHAFGDVGLREELASIFATRTRADWVQLFINHDVAGAPVYGPEDTHADPHFASRDLWTDGDVHGLELMASPVRVDGKIQSAAHAAPRAGDHTLQVLTDVLGYDPARISELSASGAVAGRELEPRP